MTHGQGCGQPPARVAKCSEQPFLWIDGLYSMIGKESKQCESPFLSLAWEASPESVDDNSTSLKQTCMACCQVRQQVATEALLGVCYGRKPGERPERNPRLFVKYCLSRSKQHRSTCSFFSSRPSSCWPATLEAMLQKLEPSSTAHGTADEGGSGFGPKVQDFGPRDCTRASAKASWSSPAVSKQW